MSQSSAPRLVTPIRAALALALLLVCGVTLIPHWVNAATAPGLALSQIPSGCAYQIQPGDSLARIAPRYHTTWQALAAVNKIAYPYVIYSGAYLDVCPGLGASTAASQPVTAALRLGPAARAGWPVAIYHPAHYADQAVWGQCVWYVASQRSDLDLRGAGNAKDLTANLARRGYHTGTLPAVGAIVVFAPGVEGASSYYGHTAIVDSINASDPYRFTIREVNRTGVRSVDGGWGGPGKVDLWGAWVAPGISFIYG